MRLIEVHDDRNKCKEYWHYDGDSLSYEVNNRIVFLMVQSQRLERTDESVPEVEPYYGHAYYVKNHIPYIRVRKVYNSIEIFNYFAIVGLGGDISPVHFSPKTFEVNNQENQN